MGIYEEVEEENPLDWRQELLTQIDAFECSTDETLLFFPFTLSASQRWFLHEKAELRGLSHKSVDEDNQRRIVLEKQTSSEKEKKEQAVVVDRIVIKVRSISIILQTLSPMTVLWLKFNFIRYCMPALYDKIVRARLSKANGDQNS